MSHAPVWSRPEPEQRTPRPPLSRAAIVAAAIRLADAEDLDAVSIRRVAALLDARPMTLYSYIGSKDALLELMFEELAGTVTDGDPRPGDDWRAAMMAIAARKRRLCLA